MEAVLKNSINSTINTSQASNPSTARLLIDHIKRLVEDDMKSTVEAFKLIESEIDVELSSTYPKKMFERNRISKSRSCTSGPRQNKSEKRKSLQPNHRFPSTVASKRSRKSLISNIVPEKHFESDNIEGSTDYDCGSYNHPHLEQEKLPSWHEENRYIPEATATPIKSPVTFPSIDENGTSARSESTVTNPYNYRGYQSQSYSDNSKLLTVEAMYQDLKADLNRIFERFAQDSNKINATTINNLYEETPGSLYCDQTSQSSFEKAHRTTATNNKCAKGIILPQLLAFGDNRNNNNNRKNDNGKGVTIINEPFSWPDGEGIVDDRTEKNKETPNFWSSELDSERYGKLNASDNCVENTEIHEKYNENPNNASQKPTDSEGEVINTVDLNILPENGGNNTNNYVTLTDIEESITETTREDGLTNTISSSLIFTPKTTNKSSVVCTDLNDIEIALLISQASPDRRIIIKKKVPEVAVKGYHKNCNEKLIFSGDKVTHVKTDRKVICRKYIPK